MATSPDAFHSEATAGEPVASPAAGAAMRKPDFSRPRKLSTVDVAALRGVQERFARGVQVHLARLLRCEAVLACEEPDEVTLSGHVRELDEATVVAGVQVVPIPGLLLLEIGPRIGLAVLERLLGGTGAAGGTRALTVLETGLIARVVGQILPSFAEALAPAPVEPALAGVGSGSEALTGPSPVEPAVALPFTLTLSTGNPPAAVANGPVVVFGLLSTFRPLLDLLAPPPANDMGTAGEKHAAATAPAGASVGPLLGDVPVALTVRLRPARIPAGDIAALQPGDVLRLDHGVGEPAIGSVGGVELLEGFLGGRARRLGIRFSGWRQGQ